MTKKFALFVAVLAGVLSLAHVSRSSAASGACTAPATDYGKVSFSSANSPANPVTIAAGTYRVWARVQVPDTTNNSFLLDIDGNTCFKVQTSVTTPTNSWVWINYENGSTTTPMNVTLSGTSHNITMYGNAPNVMVDKVIFVTSTTCIPTNTRDTSTNPVTEPGSDCVEADNNAPVVSITNPATGNNQGTINVTVNATDQATGDTGVQSVDIYDGATKLGSATRSSGTAANGTWTYSWNTTSLTPGSSHTLTARATDNASPTPKTSTSSAVTVTIRDTVNPTVNVTAPTNGSTQSGTITLTATASDSYGVKNVAFFVDGTTQVGAADTSSPYSVSLDTTQLSNATHVITAKATDTSDNIGTSTGISITVNNTPPASDTTKPTVSIVSPLAGDIISTDQTGSATPTGKKSNAFTVSASALDASGIQQVVFAVDGVTKFTDTAAPYSYDMDATGLSCTAAVSGLGTGHTITVTATDNSSNHNSQTATISLGATRGADVNGDCRVQLLDYSAVVSKFGQTGAGVGRSDINMDGTVQLLDYSSVVSKFGT